MTDPWDQGDPVETDVPLGPRDWVALVCIIAIVLVIAGLALFGAPKGPV